MGLRVLLVHDDEERTSGLERAIAQAGYEIVGVVASGPGLLEQVRRRAADVIVLDRDSPDRDTLEHLCLVTRDQPRPIVMFAQDGDRATIRAAVQAGVAAYVVGAVPAERIRPIVEVAIARFEEMQRLRDELRRARVSVEERKAIERAKGILAKTRGLTEDEAYRVLRKAAMDRNQRLAQVAENVIALAKLFT